MTEKFGGQVVNMRTETIVLNEARNVNLTAYIQDTGGAFGYVTKRPAILILPGGGYQYCSDREADPVAMAYLKAGYQVFILRYSVKEDAKWPNPLDDYEQAMELIRSREEEWKLYPDKVAVIGFSAGGHLAAAAATMSKNRPNAAILGYAVAGADVKACNPSAPDTIAAVDRKTCPCFLFATRTDNLVPVLNSIKFMEALTKADVSFESHIYAYGPHGFSTCDTSIQSRDTVICERVPNWVTDSIGWLRDMLGDFGEGCMTEPVCKAHVNDDDEEFLSVDCSVGCILKSSKGREFVEGILVQAAGGLTGQSGNAMKFEGDMAEFISKMTLRYVMEYGNAPQELIEDVNRKLSGIKNEIVSL